MAPAGSFGAPGGAPGAAASSTDEDSKRRVSKKLQKRRRDDHPAHTSAMELPERLKGGDDESEEEVVAPQGPGMFMNMNMNHSIFGLIAAAGSQVNFNDRFEGQSSDEDDDGDSDKPGKGRDTNISKTTVFRKPKSSADGKGDRHKRKLSEHKLLKSLPALPRLSRSKSKKESTKLFAQTEEPAEMDIETSTSPAIEITGEGSRLAPVMSRMLEARAEMSSRPSFDLDTLSGEKAKDGGAEEGPSLLAKKLMEIFEFDQPETVIEGTSTTLLTFLETEFVGRVTLLTLV